MGCWRWRLALSSYQDQVDGSFSKPGLQQSLHHVQQLAKELWRTQDKWGIGGIGNIIGLVWLVHRLKLWQLNRQTCPLSQTS